MEEEEQRREGCEMGMVPLTMACTGSYTFQQQLPCPLSILIRAHALLVQLFHPLVGQKTHGGEFKSLFPSKHSPSAPPPLLDTAHSFLSQLYNWGGGQDWALKISNVVTNKFTSNTIIIVLGY